MIKEEKIESAKMLIRELEKRMQEIRHAYHLIEDQVAELWDELSDSVNKIGVELLD